MQAFPPLRDISRQIDAERKRGATHLAVVTEKLSTGGRRGKPSVHSCRGGDSAAAERQLQASTQIPSVSRRRSRCWRGRCSLVGTEQIFNEALGGGHRADLQRGEALGGRGGGG